MDVSPLKDMPPKFLLHSNAQSAGKMVMTEKTPISSVYSLSLSNGHSWDIHAEINLEKWLLNFATILGLSQTLPRDGVSDFYITLEESVEENLSIGTWQELPNRYVRIFLSNKNRDIVCIPNREFLTSRLDETVLMLFVMQAIYASEISSGGLPLHAAMVHWNECGILLAGQGGIGKSTCAMRLPLPWQAISDDTCLAVYSGENTFSMHPMPTWSVFFDYQDWEASWKVEKSFPIQLICFLERGASDEIIALGSGEAAACLYQSALQVWRGTHSTPSAPDLHQQWVKRIFQNSCSLSHMIPSTRLKFTKEGRFWEKIETFLGIT